MRIDQWLWAVRVYRSRSLAADAIRAGHVVADCRVVKAAHEVIPGETIRVTLGALTRTLVVRGIPQSRVGAARVPEFADDQTPVEEFEKARRERPLRSVFPSLHGELPRQGGG